MDETEPTVVVDELSGIEINDVLVLYHSSAGTVYMYFSLIVPGPNKRY